MAPLYLKSSAAAKVLGVPYYVLVGLLRSGRFDPPAKDTSGDYVWLDEDISRARTALAARRAKSPLGKAVPHAVA